MSGLFARSTSADVKIVLGISMGLVLVSIILIYSPWENSVVITSTLPKPSRSAGSPGQNGSDAHLSDGKPIRGTALEVSLSDKTQTSTTSHALHQHTHPSVTPQLNTSHLFNLGQHSPQKIKNGMKLFNSRSMSGGGTGPDDKARLRFEIKMAKLGNVSSDARVVYDRNNIPDGLRRIAPELFQKFPRTFLPEYKSPCWMSDGELKCLPYFFIAGFPKCATTDLWGKVTRHPDVVVTTKEPQWWTRSQHLAVGFEGHYLSFQNKVIKEMKLNNRTDLVNCDGSALTLHDNKYIIDHHSDADLRESVPYLTADLLRALIPDTKVIGIVRNPTDRAYSAFMYFRGMMSKGRANPRGFHDIVKTKIKEFYRCLDKHSLRHCFYNGQYIPVTTGCYSIVIRDWLKRFPRDQLFFLRTEDFKEVGVPAILKDIFNFLDLDPLSHEERVNMTTGKKKNKGKAYGNMLPETRQLLDDFFKPCNRDLALLLGDDRYLWQN